LYVEEVYEKLEKKNFLLLEKKKEILKLLVALDFYLKLNHWSLIRL